MSGTNKHDAQIHPEVEDLEDLRLGKSQYHDPGELSKGNTG